MAAELSQKAIRPFQAELFFSPEKKREAITVAKVPQIDKMHTPLFIVQRFEGEEVHFRKGCAKLISFKN